MKPYLVITPEIVKAKRGLVNDTFERLIGPANNLFSFFMKTHRYDIDAREKDKKFEFYIYDKNPQSIAAFKLLLNWDGESNLIDYLKINNLNTVPFDYKLTIDKLIKTGFKADSGYQFKDAWNYFKSQKFNYIEIDAVINNKEFLTFLYTMNKLEKTSSRQFLSLDFNPNDYDKEVYTEALNNILHLLWMRKFRGHPTLVQIPDNFNQPIEDFAGKLYAKLNPTFCILPWMHIQYKPSGQPKLCCRHDILKERKEYDVITEQQKETNTNLVKFFPIREQATIQTTPMEDVFYGEYWDAARNNTVKGLEISGCHKCYKEEHNDEEVSTSMRLGSSILYNGGYLHKRPKFEKPIVEFLEIGFGNYCNLACLTCNSTLSTSWHDDEVELNKTASAKVQRWLFPKLDNVNFTPNEETLKTLRLIKFTGGEPMINPEFTKFINHICENGYPENISLEIYTNCSYIPSPKLLENLVKFKNIQLNLSIDAYGSANDYIRYGSKWHGDTKQTVSNAIDFWLEQGAGNANINVMMSTTLSVLNILEIPKLISWWVTKYKESGNQIVYHSDSHNAMSDANASEGFFKLQPAFDPHYVNMNILPEKYYEDVYAWAEEYKDNFVSIHPDLPEIPEGIQANITKLLQFIQKAKGNVNGATDFVEYVTAMDKIRKNSCQEALPELYNKVQDFLKNAG
jgi:hypothetical protein